MPYTQSQASSSNQPNKPYRFYVDVDGVILKNGYNYGLFKFLAQWKITHPNTEVVLLTRFQAPHYNNSKTFRSLAINALTEGLHNELSASMTSEAFEEFTNTIKIITPNDVLYLLRDKLINGTNAYQMGDYGKEILALEKSYTNLDNEDKKNSELIKFKNTYPDAENIVSELQEVIQTKLNSIESSKKTTTEKNTKGDLEKYKNMLAKDKIESRTVSKQATIEHHLTQFPMNQEGVIVHIDDSTQELKYEASDIAVQRLHMCDFSRYQFNSEHAKEQAIMDFYLTAMQSISGLALNSEDNRKLFNLGNSLNRGIDSWLSSLLRVGINWNESQLFPNPAQLFQAKLQQIEGLKESSFKLIADIMEMQKNKPNKYVSSNQFKTFFNQARGITSSHFLACFNSVKENIQSLRDKITDYRSTCNQFEQNESQKPVALQYYTHELNTLEAALNMLEQTLDDYYDLPSSHLLVQQPPNTVTPRAGSSKDSSQPNKDGEQFQNYSSLVLSRLIEMACRLSVEYNTDRVNITQNIKADLIKLASIVNKPTKEDVALYTAVNDALEQSRNGQGDNSQQVTRFYKSLQQTIKSISPAVDFTYKKSNLVQLTQPNPNSFFYNAVQKKTPQQNKPSMSIQLS